MLDNVELNAHPPELGEAVKAVYERDGFLRFKEFFSPDLIERHAGPIKQRGAPSHNAWRTNDGIKEFVFGRRLAGIAAQLMGADHVRLVRDDVSCQQTGDKETEWRSNESDDLITVWVPIQETTLDMGPIAYAVGSHHHKKPPEAGRGIL